jgi:predicted GIY-YIG superfamily endonuclease
MKKYYVYEIVNLMGTVEYVGESINPKRRWIQHKCKVISNGQGTFANRSDVFMNVVNEFDNRRNALDKQYELQIEYGLKTDLEKKRYICTKETKLKLSIAHKGNKYNLGNTHSIESKNKISKKVKGKNNPMYGKIHSTETLKKISNKLKGRVISDEHKQKLSEASKAMWINRKQIVK